MILAFLLSVVSSAEASDRCSVDLAESPRVVAALDFSPLPDKCKRYAPETCRPLVTNDSKAPQYATYRLACSKVEAPPPPPAPREDPRLTALKRGRWIEGAAILVPEGSFCGSVEQVARMIEADYPALATPRDTPREREPRVRVWSVTVDDDSGYLKLGSPDLVEDIFGREPNLVPEEACRKPLKVDGQTLTPKTRIIVATCRGTTPPDISGGCDSARGPIRSDLRRLTTGVQADRGAALLASLAAVDAEVEELRAAGPPKAPPPPPRRLYECTEDPRPVPLQSMLAVWSESRSQLHDIAEQVEGDRCFATASDLDPDGLILALVSRFWEEAGGAEPAGPENSENGEERPAGGGLDGAADLETLRQLWQLDPALGRALLTALDQSVGRNPALLADELHRIARRALEAPRGFRLQDVAAYEDARDRVRARIADGEPSIPRIRAAAVDARVEYRELEARLDGWPPHARDASADLEDRRQKMSDALRDPDVRRRRVGKALMLDLHALRSRIAEDPVHAARIEAARIAQALEGNGENLVAFCRTALDEATALVPPPMSLEEALRDPATFRARREAVTTADRMLDREPCARAELVASQMKQRVRNLETQVDRIDPSDEEHPTLDEAEKLLRRCDRWLRRAAR